MSKQNRNQRIAGEFFDGALRLADVLVAKYAVERSMIDRHAATLAKLTYFSDGREPSAVHFKQAKTGITFTSTITDPARSLTVWLSKLSAGDIAIDTPKGLWAANDRNLERWFTWLLEGVPKRNHARLRMLELERQFYAPFACGWYQESENGKQLRLPKDEIIRKRTIREVFDRFRRMFPDKDGHILVINALKRNASRPEDIGEMRLQAAFLEKAFYHGG